MTLCVQFVIQCIVSLTQSSHPCLLPGQEGGLAKEHHLQLCLRKCLALRMSDGGQYSSLWSHGEDHIVWSHGLGPLTLLQVDVRLQGGSLSQPSLDAAEQAKQAAYAKGLHAHVLHAQTPCYW